MLLFTCRTRHIADTGYLWAFALITFSKQFGGDRAKICAREIATTVRQLEMFPDKGSCLQDLIEYPTDYHYLVVKPNYIFYRIEGDTVRIIRILNEKQDFLQILFGISSISEEGENF